MWAIAMHSVQVCSAQGYRTADWTGWSPEGWKALANSSMVFSATLAVIIAVPVVSSHVV